MEGSTSSHKFGAPRSVLPGPLLDGLQACRWSHLWRASVDKAWIKSLIRSAISSSSGKQIFEFRFAFVSFCAWINGPVRFLSEKCFRTDPNTPDDLKR